MWQQLKVGGTLLYITCSILKVENEQQMVDFLQTIPMQKKLKSLRIGV
jgi:16S rRNA (cytosine967-C5)-methyltransferase